MAKNRPAIVPQKANEQTSTEDTMNQKDQELAGKEVEQEVVEQPPADDAVAEAPKADQDAQLVQDPGTENAGVVEAEQEPELDAWSQKIEDIKKNGSIMERTVVQTLQDYVTQMRPGNIVTPVEINQQQLQLWRIIKLVIESGEDFETCFNLIIAYARQFKDACFDDRLLYRGMDNITLDKDTTTYYLGTLNVIKIAATSKSKKEVTSQVDLDRVMNEQVFSDDGRNRVIQYFSR